jgi:ferredoxin
MEDDMPANADNAPLELTLDPTACQGYAICLGIAPDVFDMPAGSPVAVLLRTSFPASDRPMLEEAVRNCPAQAIALSVA